MSPRSLRLIGQLAYFFGCLLSQANAAEEYPHIVIILADDLGYGDPRCNFADSKLQTPAMDPDGGARIAIY